eukprot:6186865-Pleurochrysis_carterae.AAC.5
MEDEYSQLLLVAGCRGKVKEGLAERGSSPGRPKNTTELYPPKRDVLTNRVGERWRQVLAAQVVESLQVEAHLEHRRRANVRVAALRDDPGW